MVTAVFSDVHGNLPALERFVALTRGIDAFVCLGDVVNYGPWNDECLELVLSLPGIVLLEGNHERLFLGTEPAGHEAPLVQAFLEHSSASFTRTDLITGLPRDYQLGRYLCTHTIDDRRIYADTAFSVSCDTMIGHTHHQFRVERSGHTIINCGSIGQNRARLDVLNYVVYDDVTDSVELRGDRYDADRLIQEMVARGYPDACLEYLRGKLVRG